MDREITEVQYKWWGVCLSKYQWINMLSLLVREIAYIAKIFETLCIYQIGPDNVSFIGSFLNILRYQNNEREQFCHDLNNWNVFCEIYFNKILT
jgi:hypothetical protein